MSGSTPSGTSSGTKAQMTYGRFITSPHFALVVGPSKTTFYLHKELLGKVSPELRKHTHNEMKEGQENSMNLPDVLEDTVARFIEWAYTNDYPDEVTLPPTTEESDPPQVLKTATKGSDQSSVITTGTSTTSTAAMLLHHARLYVFADRFNISDLKTLTFTKLSTAIQSLGYLKHPRDVSDTIDLLCYAFDNLPLTKSGETLLNYLSSYASWTFGALRKDNSLWALTAANAEFVKCILQKLSEASAPPWPVTEEAPAAPAKNLKPKADLLKRSCYNCSYVGCFRVQCASCAYADPVLNDCGEMMDLDKITNLTGQQTNLRFTCRNCNRTNSPTLCCARCGGSSFGYA